MPSQSESRPVLGIDPKTLLVTAGCLFGALYSSYLLYRDIHSRGVRTGTPMAKLERTEQKVRMKPAESFIWGNVGANERLYMKDSVQTAPQGGASIRFNDGTLLEVGENSLIIIDSIENLSLNFLRGSIVVRSQSGDSKITIGKDGKAQVEKLPIRLISPEPLSEFFVAEKSLRTIEFAWEMNLKAGDAAPDKVEVAPDSSFRSSVRSFQVADAKSKIAAPLPAGKYFWRVSGHGKPLTEPSQFRVEGVLPIKPLFPTASEKIPTFGEEGAVQFRWAPAPEEAAKVEHKLELASDAQFKNIIRSQAIAPNSGISAMKGVANGWHFWRIVSHYPDLALPSATEKFEVEKVAKFSVELNKPDDNSVLDIKNEPKFSWSSPSASVQYRWQLRPAESPDKVQSVETRASTHLWSSPSTGAYQWRVQAVYNDQVVGESAWRSFFGSSGSPIALVEPAQKQEIHYWTDPKPFSFKWKKAEDVSDYVVEVSSTADFKAPATAGTSDTELASKQVPMSPGSLFWRVKGLDSSKRVVRISDVTGFNYGPFPLLRAPASAKPDSGAVINPLETEKNPVVSWSPVENAESYDLIVKQGEKILLQQNVKETQFELKDLEAGKYQYSIRAIDQAQRKGEPLVDRPFEINFGATLAAPETTSEEVQ